MRREAIERPDRGVRADGSAAFRLRWIAIGALGAVLAGCGGAGDDLRTEGGNLPPEVRILQPAHESRHPLGEKIAVHVEAVDPEERLQQVRLRFDGSHVALEPVAEVGDEYRGTVTAGTLGWHRLVAGGVDDGSASGSAEISLEIVDEEPAEDEDEGGSGEDEDGEEGSAEPDPAEEEEDGEGEPGEDETEAEIVLDVDMLTLNPGSSRRLTATVTGLDDERVRWAATAGTITGEGSTVTYAAPSLLGRYAVTASAVADEELTATVDVQVPPTRFTVIVLPDTQNMIKREGDTMADQMTSWIVDDPMGLDIGFVTHVGDVVDEAIDLSEWERAHAALSRLDGEVPYSVALGDHEYEVEENMGTSTENYVAYFGPGRYASYEWYAGSSDSGKNHYQIFDAGGRRFLHIALEWEAPGPASDPSTPLGWARAILEEHPDLPTLITTHAYVWDYPHHEGRTWREHQLEGYIERDDGTMGHPGSTGQDIFEALVEPYPQVFMVLNGHYHKAEGTDQGEWHQVSRNAAGSEVYEMLSNYQSYPQGGNGWLRIVEFQPRGGEEADRISVRTYSPVLNEHQTDARSHFSFELDFDERLGVPVLP